MLVKWIRVIRHSCFHKRKSTSSSLAKFHILKTRGEFTVSYNTFNSLDVKIENGNLLLTTYRTIFFIGTSGIEVPHFFVSKIEKTVSRILKLFCARVDSVFFKRKES